MANQKNFAITPSVSISRSKFRRPSQHKTSFNLGKLVPIYVDADILPGDTVSIDLAALVRMSTPIAPIMDNIYIDYYAFFVPNRLVWTGWKAFMGENTSTSGAVTEPTFPTIEIGSSNKPQVGSLGDYMGLPTVTGTGNLGVSALPGRSYLLIYNEWFRDQNLIAPLYVETGNVQLRLGQNNGSNLFYNMSLLTAAKESDYFTRALPYAQKGSPVTLPLGSTAPVYLAGSNLIAGAVTLSTDATSIGVQNLHQLTAANAGDTFHGFYNLEKNWPESVKIEIQPDETVIMRAKTRSYSGIRKFVLGFGTGVEVLEPEWFRNAIRDWHRKAADMYGPSEESESENT